jgi:hypothetical protein
LAAIVFSDQRDLAEHADVGGNDAARPLCDVLAELRLAAAAMTRYAPLARLAA